MALRGPLGRFGRLGSPPRATEKGSILIAFVHEILGRKVSFVITGLLLDVRHTSNAPFDLICKEREGGPFVPQPSKAARLA